MESEHVDRVLAASYKLLCVVGHELTSTLEVHTAVDAACVKFRQLRALQYGLAPSC